MDPGIEPISRHRKCAGIGHMRMEDGLSIGAGSVTPAVDHEGRNLPMTMTINDIAVKVDSDDVVQSIFRTFFRRAAVGDYDVPDDMDLWNLLVTISLNKIREIGRYYRRARRDIGKSVPLSETTVGNLTAGADEVACQVLEMVVDEAIAALPEAQQRIIRLHIEGWNVPEIAADTQRSKRTVERVLQEFRLKLKEQIQSDHSDRAADCHE